jgi:hypothetical protein
MFDEFECENEQCHQLFVPVAPNQRFCTELCRKQGTAHGARDARRTEARTNLGCRRCGERFQGARRDSTICDRCKTEKPTIFVGVDGEGIQGRCTGPRCPCRRFVASAENDNLCICGHHRLQPPMSNRTHRRAGIAPDFGHEHSYVLLGCGDQQIADPDGLDHTQIFPFLYDQFRRRPDAAYVGFFLGYDFTCWLRSVPDTKAWLLLTEAGRRRRTLRRASFPQVAPVRIDEHRIADGQAWELQWLVDRRLSIRPMVCDCAAQAGRRCKHKPAPWMHICDAGPFWQSSFLTVIAEDQWPGNPVCDPDEYAEVSRGKASRADAALDDDMRRYNRLENEILPRIMARLDQGFRAIGVWLTKSKWYGPGAASAQWLDNIGAPRRETIEQVTPTAVLKAAIAAYTGGWFEVFMHGRIPGVTFEYDISSAYPAVIAQLPCLLHGTWTHDRRKTLPAIDHATHLRLVHCPPGAIVGSDPYIGAMLHRQADESILRPHVTGGWYWQHELEAAIRAGLIDRVRTDQAWTYQRCHCPHPIQAIADLYDHRLRVGKTTPAGKAAKLVMNSVYGKFAEGSGSRPFGNYPYAGLITAGCRTEILDAIATHPMGSAAVAMVATDAVFFSAPHPTLPLSDEQLGRWTLKERRNLTIFKPGVWWDDDDREARRAGHKPIFKARGINAKAFAKHLDQIDADFAALVNEGNVGPDIDWPHITYRCDFSQITARLALHRHQWDTAGTVCEIDQTHSSDPAHKRHSPYLDPDLGVIRTRPHRHADGLESRPYVRSSARAELAAILGEVRPERFDEYDSPDGPIGSVLYGMLGTGQWA